MILQVAITMFFLLLLIASGYDLKKRIIPDWVIVMALAPALVMSFYHQTIICDLITSLAGGLFFLALALITKGGVGGGDIKLVTVTGLALGPIGLVLALIATFPMGLIGGLITKGKVLPLAPFLTMGTVLSFLITK